MEQSRHGEGVTSVKVHHPSGGASSFSLAHDDGTDDRWGNSNKIGNAPKPSTNNNIFGGAPQQSTSNNIFGGPQQTTALPSEQARQEAPAAGTGAFTSVKYSGNPPGGKSSITF